VQPFNGKRPLLKCFLGVNGIWTCSLLKQLSTLSCDAKVTFKPRKDGAFFTSYFITCLLLQKQGTLYPESTKILEYRVSFKDLVT
jgi:hypothetical protein